MQTARVTILMSPDKKTAFDAVAAERGLSTGEFFRRAGDREAQEQAEDEATLAAVNDELEAALPQMRADIAAMRSAIAEARSVIAAYRREKAAAMKAAA